MASVSGMPPMLRLARSGQSGAKVMTAPWQVIYTESSTIAYLFTGATIDLSTMAAGDIVNLRVRKITVQGGAWANAGQTQYTDAQPVNHPVAFITPVPDIYGVEIAMQQTAGVLRSFPTEFYDAKRLGLP